MKLYIGADHNGFAYKHKLIALLQKSGHEVIDCTPGSQDPRDDFPILASRVVNELMVSEDPEAKAILVCGSGQGMAMAANRFKGIRASLCWSVEEARAVRNDDDSNVLCLTARYLPMTETEKVVYAWLNTPFAGASRFKRRIKQLDQLNP